MAGAGSSAAPERKLPFRWRSPTWSPASTMLAFAGGSSEWRGVFRVMATGKRLRPIAFEKTRPATSSEPLAVAWAPRGTKVVWEEIYGRREFKVFVGDARRQGKRRIARSTIVWGAEPAWSPRGRVIAYAGRVGIHLIAPTGRGDRRLTARPLDHSPSWAPGGRYLVFVRSLEEYSPGFLYVVQRDGRGLRRLSSREGSDPSWSPDGRQIAFTVDDGADGSSAIYVVDADGTDERRLTTTYLGYEAAWSPNSTALAFVRQANDDLANIEIAVIARDGAGGERFVAGRYATSPVWSPDGKRIAYVEQEPPPTCAGPYQVVVVSAKGGRSRQVTPCKYGRP
jgi:Tol biopolymer transport system component